MAFIGLMIRVARSWSTRPGLCAQQIAIVQSIVTPLQCPGREERIKDGVPKLQYQTTGADED